MDIVRDSFWRGRLIVWQPARGQGYRFNVDSVVLAAAVPPARHLLDLGAGCGILGLLLLASGRVGRVTAVEVQPELAALVRRNAQANGLAARLRVLELDLRCLTEPLDGGALVDGVAFNPPYFPRTAARAAANPCRDGARRELHGGLADFVACAQRQLAPGGHCSAIVRWERGAELLALWDAGLGTPEAVLRPVCAAADQPPRHALLRARRAPGPAPAPQPPLVLHVDGGYAAPLQPWLEGPASLSVDAATAGLAPSGG